MAAKKTSSARRPVRRGGKLIPALCNVLGTLILLAVIAVSVPLSVPRLFGYEAYDVVSGSMEPAIPIGSVVYVGTAEPENVQPGEIIAFYSNGVVVTHRVIENRFVVGRFITKGDANAENDVNPVAYNEFIGVVKYHIPMLGNYLMIFSKQVTKIYLLCLAACGVMFNMLGSRIRQRNEERFQARLARWERQQDARLQAELKRIRAERRNISDLPGARELSKDEDTPPDDKVKERNVPVSD